jgi:hypothetical protein
MTEPADEFTELFDADFKRVDLVGKAANGTSFLIAKGQPGLIDPDVVRALAGAEVYHASHEHGQRVEGGPVRDEVTLTGSPAAIAKMIHNAPTRPDVSKETTMTAPADVAKADDAPVAVNDLIDSDAANGSQAETVPGSPDWETLDAETAERAISVLGRAKAAVEWLKDRETVENAAGDDYDGGNIADLEAACCALECVIGTLGAFVAGEMVEAEVGEELGGVLKTVWPALVSESSGLHIIEQLAPIAKAGRVLSTANEGRIRSATEQLEQVLASLPAPVADVAKEEEPTVTEPAPVDDAADVEKAKGDPQLAVFSETGKLVGTIDPKDLNPIATPSADGDAADASAEPASEDELQPQPAADAGTPAHAAPAEPAPAAEAAPAAAPAAPAEEDDTVAKSDLESIVEKAVRAALEDQAAGHADVVKALEDRLTHLEAPAPPKVLSNGQLPPAHQMRGQDRGSSTVDVTKAAELRDAYYASTDAVERESIHTQRQELANAAMRERMTGNGRIR